MTLQDWRTPILTIAILSYFLCLSGINLAQEAYWADEIFTLHVASMSWPEFWARLRLDSVHPPLHYLAAKLVLAIGFDPLLSLRWLSIVAGAATLLVLCSGGHLLAAFLLASNAWFVHYSQEARGYAFLFAGTACMLWSLEKRKPSLILFASIGWMLWSHYFGILYALAALLVYRERWRTFAAALATMIPWAMYVSPRFFNGEVNRQLSWLQPPNWTNLLLFFSKIDFGWRNSWAGAAFLFCLLFLAWHAWRMRDQLRLLWAVVALAPPLAVFFLAQAPLLGLHYFFYRYFLVSAIPASLLLAASHPRAPLLCIPLALFVSLPYTIDMRRESARFDSIRVARDLQGAPHPPVYAWDGPFNAAPINLYCRPACVEAQPKNLDELPNRFWLLSWPEDRDLNEFDWRRGMRSRGYTTRSIRLYPKREDFQLHSLEIVEYSRP